MRVLWITEHYPPSRGGMAQSCDRIVRGLRAAGVEVDVAHLTRRARPWRDEHVRAGRRTIGLIGQLKVKKGVEFFLDALAASGHAEAFHLPLVGEVEEPVTERPAGDIVPHSFLPFLERYDLPAVYASCDLVALPSFYDGMPNVALEAAALGVPLLASDAGGLADVADDEIGFVFRVGDPHGCRAAIDRAARAGDEELARLGAAGAERVRRDFTPAAETAGYLAVLDAVR